MEKESKTSKKTEPGMEPAMKSRNTSATKSRIASESSSRANVAQTTTLASLRCHHPNENWLCLCCKDALCSRFINRHMLEHYQETTTHCVALSYSDLSVWCFSCDAYLDAQVILPLRPVYETAYLLKFGEAPPLRSVEYVVQA
ncbi:hypothetical protein RHGRI_013811 [Rhododendron griersonianum]|uniref:UBP-type domain-containing protein n=1 Tax=Rhododendron griersonianum TaxID=479676 RepID=A0AAV6K7I3_9ERIC|nr:hypothetical protein RHGRI_013811 [Rhododendron griersonianum]